jgi:hypothetical protein
MLDNELIQVFYPILISGFVDYGITIKIRQSYQPTQTGTEKNPVLTFFKVSDYRYGWPKKFSYWDEDLLEMKHLERQVYETKFQISCLSAQDPTNINSLTSSDIANTASAIMQSDATISELVNNEIGIIRVSEIRNPNFSDDRDQFEFSPSFDFTLRHIQERIVSVPDITLIEQRIYKVN